MQLYKVYLLFLVSFTCFERCFRPSSGAVDCIYSFWLYSLKLLPAGVMKIWNCSFNVYKAPAGRNLNEYYQKL